ncbi:hypothetical protein PCANC_02363 [Puccinia coronata f. sp. avenae]|uniref:Uncharacterized protein n=1 Tax=Puccinia coronata f. sp. avenae TaxID=200324 RepID=A0A2N5VZF8_9BASI|nr:hypothetical protein PCASD_00094 [Puccinia coronata f. sp. avenae]PLW55381.1 hypothetical protein PCANC_02363 [Puccinia coronata f. sp. avenae]
MYPCSFLCPSPASLSRATCIWNRPTAQQRSSPNRGTEPTTPYIIPGHPVPHRPADSFYPANAVMCQVVKLMPTKTRSTFGQIEAEHLLDLSLLQQSLYSSLSPLKKRGGAPPMSVKSGLIDHDFHRDQRVSEICASDPGGRLQFEDSEGKILELLDLPSRGLSVSGLTFQIRPNLIREGPLGRSVHSQRHSKVSSSLRASPPGEVNRVAIRVLATQTQKSPPTGGAV